MASVTAKRLMVLYHLITGKPPQQVNGPFRAGLIDPPWEHTVWSKDTGQGRSAEAHYNTMKLEDLAKLPIGNLFSKHSVLGIWTTWPHLADALYLGFLWGFEYKTLLFDWLKRTKTGSEWHEGMGHWTRANSEPCLLFTRGRPRRQSKGVRQLIVHNGQLELFPPIVSNLSTHSAKPYEQYYRLQALVNGPYIEIFARVKFPGWTSIGFDVDGLDIRESIPKVLAGDILPNPGSEQHIRGLIHA